MIGCAPAILPVSAMLGAMPCSGQGSSAAGWRAGGAISVDADMRGAWITSRNKELLRDVCFLGDDMLALTSQGVLVRIESNGKQSVLLSRPLLAGTNYSIARLRYTI